MPISVTYYPADTTENFINASIAKTGELYHYADHNDSLLCLGARWKEKTVAIEFWSFNTRDILRLEPDTKLVKFLPGEELRLIAV